MPRELGIALGMAGIGFAGIIANFGIQAYDTGRTLDHLKFDYDNSILSTALGVEAVRRLPSNTYGTYAEDDNRYVLDSGKIRNSEGVIEDLATAVSPLGEMGVAALLFLVAMGYIVNEKIPQ